MAIYTVRFKSREEVAENTMAFHFERPEQFVFKAGQFVDITLLHPPETDEEGNIRTFSIASAPYEPGLFVATRLRDSAFKRVLKTMAIGTEVKLEGPFGSFTLHEKRERPAVFLVGGIGITPFRSMILDAAKRGLSQEIFLFYSNRRPEGAPFWGDLERAAAENNHFHLIGTMTDIEHSKKTWAGETGYINSTMLERYLKGAGDPIFYSAGPPEMVAAMKKMLNDRGVSDDDIRIEEFAGY